MKTFTKGYDSAHLMNKPLKEENILSLFLNYKQA